MQKKFIAMDELTFLQLEAAGRALKCTAADEVLGLAVQALIEQINKNAVEKSNKVFAEQCEDWQLHPASFEDSNAVFGPPIGKSEDEVASLSAAFIQWGDVPAVLSCWKPTEAQIETIRRTGRLWLAVIGETMPPVCLCSENPLDYEGIELL